MKIRVYYFDEQNDQEVNFDGTIDIDGWPDERVMAKITDAAEHAHGITIDHGGDDEFYELYIADYDPAIDINAVCRQLLQDVENALNADRT